MSYRRNYCSRSIVLILSLILVWVCAVVAFADVKLPAVMSDNMVLQGGRKVPIWGWAEPGEKVKVKGSWQWFDTATKADKDGKWTVKIQTPKAGGPYKITIKGKNTIAVENILSGEVWVCSGQSNMDWSVKASNNADQEIATAKYPEIRLFTVERKIAEQPQSDCKGDWVLCSPQTVGEFSAVAYFFGRQLHEELKVPIGLIHASWGGSPAEAWMSNNVLQSDPDYKPILDRYKKAVEDYPKVMEEYEHKLAVAKEIAAEAKTKGQKLSPEPPRPGNPVNNHAPSGLYNAMIAPLIPYRIQGVLWYQGESNVDRAYQYRKLFPAMIGNWRNDWGQGDFPFLFVQLANCGVVKTEPYENVWSELQEAQLMTLALPNTAMAVTIDIGDANSVHPKNKQDVGRRLALWAFAKVYGRKLVYSGPIYESMNVKDNKIVLHFENNGSGLVARGGESLKGFAIAGADRRFVLADAQIDGDTVVVGSDKVGKPVAVRYAWAENPVCNLYNRDGLPASPFRTDDWPGITIDKK